MKTVAELKVKLFGDGADKSTILELHKNPLIKGFTTNPTLMRKAGIKDYEIFAKDILAAVPDRPFSLEVFADEFNEMERQARLITSWGKNVYVKIPITNTRREESCSLIRKLSLDGIKVNVTAVMTLLQVEQACWALHGGAPAYVSVFAGRIADTGRDPAPDMRKAVLCTSLYPGVELIWASPRELLNIFQADDAGVHIITATNDILKKLSLVGKDLTDYSLETVQMFFNDAKALGYTL
jgi:transaldolase